jgi:hypothetical protein
MRRSGFGASADPTLALGVEAAAGTAAEDVVVDFDAHAPAATEMAATNKGRR